MTTTEVTEPAAASGAATPSSSALTCRVFRTFEDLDHLRLAWDDACLKARGSIYMTYDWLRVWWQFYGKGAELRLFVFFAGQNIEAIVPIYINTLGWGPLRFRVARLVGSNIPPKVFDPPVSESSATEVMRQVIGQLFKEDAVDLLSFGPISELRPIIKYVEDSCSQCADLVTQRNAIKGVYTVFQIPATMDDYYASLSKNERKNRRKYELRLLKKEFETRVHVETDPAKMSEEFERFAVQHAEQWAAEGKTGHFGAWPRALDFNRALVKAQSAAGRLRFIRIIANGEVIANQYTFALGDRYYWELPSREVDTKWERFSLGPTGIVTMIEQAMKEGINAIEAGLAHYDYKLRLGATEHNVFTFRILSAKPATRVRFAFFSFIRTCWSYVYHKLWYRRIMPRLPRGFWRPQPDQWLRLDF